MKRKRRPARRLFMLAAVICVLAVLSIAAAATGFFGLREALLPEKGRVNVLDENGIVVSGEYEYKDFVSLSGYQNTPESKALAEWKSFLESYDRDGAIISAIGNSPTGFEDRYGFYLVYTQEMADRLEEIIAKYGLRLHTRMEVVMPGTWPTAVGNFCKENVTAYSGYIYENGTFRFDGEAELGGTELKGYGVIEYQFSRSVRGTFDDVALNIGDFNDFEEWGYQTANGTLVTLSLGARNRSLILADLGDSFILVNVLTGREGDDTFSSGPIGREELEALADSFDFSALTPAGTPDFDAIIRENDRYLEELESQSIETASDEIEDPLDTRTGMEPEADWDFGLGEGDSPDPNEDDIYAGAGIEQDAAKAFVWDLTDFLSKGEREKVADLFVYPCAVRVSDGTFPVNTPEELLAYYDEVIGCEVQTLIASLDYHTLFTRNGLVGVGDGTAWFGLVEDGEIRLFSLWTPQGLGVGPVVSGISAG